MAVGLEQDTRIVPRHLKITTNGYEEYVPEELTREVKPCKWTPRVEALFGGDPFIRRALLGV